MSEWRRLTLADVCKVITDGAHLSPKEDPNGLPMGSVKDLTRNGVNIDSCKRVSQADFDALVRQGCSPQRGDVLIAKDGNSALDTVCVYRQHDEIVLLSSIAILRPNGEVTSDYLNYYLDADETRQMLKEGFRSGSAIPRVVLRDFRRAPICVPPIETQKDIGNVLRTLDDKIELNRRTNETLEAMARAIFKSWFVDFDPVRAKASGEPPESICRRLGLTPELLALFPDRFQDSELGNIPEGWQVATMGALCERISMGPFGSDIKSTNFVDEGVPIIRGGNLTSGFVGGKFVFLTEKKADELRNANAREGDIVITHRGTLGQVGLLPRSRYPRYVVSQSQMVLVVNRELTTPRYLYEYLRSPVGQHALLANTSQVGVPAIARPTTSVKAITLVSPPISLLRAYEGLSQSLFGQILNALEQSINLAELRDTFLPKFLSGELRIGTAQCEVEAVASC